ncbi:MAG: AAA family ATPase, partial [Bacilli bacterium]
IIIMTSNLGSESILAGQKEPVEKLLHQTFKPEFLNRIDEIVYFNPLTKGVQYKIVEKMLNELKARLAGQYYQVDFTKKLKDYVLENAYSPVYGARPIKRFIQDKVETALAEKIVKGELNTTDAYSVGVDAVGEITISRADTAA